MTLVLSVLKIIPILEKKSLRILSWFSRSWGLLSIRTISSTLIRILMTIPVRVVPTQPYFSNHSCNLSMYMPKRVGDKGHPCLNLILQLISFDHPSVFLNIAIMFSYILIATTLNLRGTFISSNLFQNFFLGTMSKYFLKLRKQQNKLVLVLRNSSGMILKVTIWSTIE
jgi:hypothetical protein